MLALNRMPAAVAGRDDILAMVEPGRVAHGGTYCGNVVAATAAAATLEILETQPVLETIAANGQVLMQGIDAILSRVGVPHVVSGVGHRAQVSARVAAARGLCGAVHHGGRQLPELRPHSPAARGAARVRNGSNIFK